MRLIYQRGDERIAFPLDEGETFIGRKDDCDIYFPDSSLSKRHARLVRRGRSLTAYDAGSKNGTMVNGELIRGATPLTSGDVLECGKLAFRVEGVGEGDFDIVDDEPRSRASAPVAKVVRSGEVRGSVLDEFPEMPRSGEVQAPVAPAGPRARFRLVEGGPERTWDLTEGETITVGSKPENAVVLSGEGISRYHAEVVHEGGKWLLKDLGARNGLFVAGKKIDIHELREGDEVQIGTSKLRFEVVHPSPLLEVQQLLAQLKADPAGTFKREPRVRMAAASLVTAVILLIMALPSGGELRAGGSTGDVAWLQEGTAKLLAGDSREARDIFRRAQAKPSTTKELQEVARGLTTMANHWVDLDKGALQFRWGRAEELLADCARLPGLPRELQEWITEQMGTVRMNKEAYEKLGEAEQLGSTAVQLAQEKKFREALKRFEATTLRYSEVPARSVYGPRAAEQSRALRGQVFKMVLDEATALMRVPSPDWQGVASFIDQGNAYADTPEQRVELRRLKEVCETNLRDEDFYQRGVDIVAVRDVENYPTATRLFERIDRRSRIYPDAQAYIQWIDADLKVRQAQRAYETGDAKRAFQLLGEALQHEVLGPEARQSVRTRRTKWGQVFTAYQRGIEAENPREAQEELLRVIQLEPSQANVYHKRALDQLRHLQRLENMNLESKVREGINALEAGDYDRAWRLFEAVQGDQNKQPRDLQRIQEAVVNANRSRRLLHHAQQDFRHDRSERFLEIYYITYILRSWLPTTERAARTEADQLFGYVVKRLQNMRKLSEEPAGRPR